MDKRTTFLDGLPFPTGVKVWRKGVLICAPDILFAEDTNGDGKADVVKEMLGGFGAGYQGSRERGSNTASTAGFTARAASTAARSRASTARNTTSATATFASSRTRARWRRSAARPSKAGARRLEQLVRLRQQHADSPLSPRRSLSETQHDVTSPPSAVFVPAGPNLNKLFHDRRSRSVSRASGPAGNVTAACGLCIYRDNLLGDDFKGNAFVCEPVNLVVHRLKLTPKGSTFEGHHA